MSHNDATTPPRLNGLFWWIDRWRKSTAYTDMTLEEQGAYRNLLDEAHLRGGPIPNIERILAKSCGDAEAWSRVRAAVLARFTLTIEGWRNATLDGVLSESLRRADKQRAYRERKAGRQIVGNEAGNASGNNAGNKAGSPSPSPSPSQDQDMSARAKRSALANNAVAGKAWTFKSLYVSPKRHEIVLTSLGTKGKDVDFDAVYEAAAIDYAEHGEPADLLGDLKKRARAAIPEWSPIPSVEETAAREARMQAEHIPPTPEEKAQIKALFKGSRSVGEKILENTSGAAAGRS